MLTAPIPDNETQRLAALRALLILDTPPEERFDKVVAFAQAEFDVPVALISLVDSERQWFKANAGLPMCQTARGISFCGHAILQPDILVVPDALADARFADNPMVTGEPHVRSYAGAPLIAPSGLALGTLCLIDYRPRQFDAVELTILATLRDLVVQELYPPAEAPHV
ncbi:GAF domain-containing protein [Rugamonas apoptosis]|uniref:GAF domain-containing protein n=1 Tax=Rugamonas apoptosis TaxID=2758570 RepID=A0A7W2FCP7_9BURK|nr:GAF domain-containing protein [Rugamonas apoptosis]MBA5689189.1 GAF domain-containing protein [Rugamonas apoptosis]